MEQDQTDLPKSLDEFETLSVGRVTKPSPSLDLSRISGDLLQSGTFQALMSQNEDLMARLNVSLRKNAQFESKLKKLLDSNDLLVRQNDALLDEMALIKEKSLQNENLFLDISAQRDEVQKAFAELYSKSKNAEDLSQKTIESLSLRLRNLQSYRRRIQNFVRPFIDQLKKRDHALTEVIKTLRANEAEHTKIVHTLNSTLKTMTEERNKTTIGFQNDLAQLAETYEAQLATLREEKEDLQTELSHLQHKAGDTLRRVEEYEEKNIILENRLISTERKLAEAEERLRQTEEDLTNENSAYRVEITTRELEIRNLRERLSRSECENDEAQATLTETQRELESFRVLQDETLRALQAASDREAKTARLNVELSHALKVQRSEVERLQHETVQLSSLKQQLVSERGDLDEIMS